MSNFGVRHRFAILVFLVFSAGASWPVDAAETTEAREAYRQKVSSWVSGYGDDAVYVGSKYANQIADLVAQYPEEQLENFKAAIKTAIQVRGNTNSAISKIITELTEQAKQPAGVEKYRKQVEVEFKRSQYRQQVYNWASGYNDDGIYVNASPANQLSDLVSQYPEERFDDFKAAFRAAIQARGNSNSVVTKIIAEVTEKAKEAGGLQAYRKQAEDDLKRAQYRQQVYNWASGYNEDSFYVNSGPANQIADLVSQYPESRFDDFKAAFRAGILARGNSSAIVTNLVSETAEQAKQPGGLEKFRKQVETELKRAQYRQEVYNWASGYNDDGFYTNATVARQIADLVSKYPENRFEDFKAAFRSGVQARGSSTAVVANLVAEAVELVKQPGGLEKFREQIEEEVRLAQYRQRVFDWAYNYGEGSLGVSLEQANQVASFMIQYPEAAFELIKPLLIAERENLLTNSRDTLSRLGARLGRNVNDLAKAGVQITREKTMTDWAYGSSGLNLDSREQAELVGKQLAALTDEQALKAQTMLKLSGISENGVDAKVFENELKRAVRYAQGPDSTYHGYLAAYQLVNPDEDAKTSLPPRVIHQFALNLSALPPAALDRYREVFEVIPPVDADSLTEAMAFTQPLLAKATADYQNALKARMKSRQDLEEAGALGLSDGAQVSKVAAVMAGASEAQKGLIRKMFEQPSPSDAVFSARLALSARLTKAQPAQLARVQWSMEQGLSADEYPETVASLLSLKDSEFDQFKNGYLHAIQQLKLPPEKALAFAKRASELSPRELDRMKWAFSRLPAESLARPEGFREALRLAAIVLPKSDAEFQQYVRELDNQAVVSTVKQVSAVTQEVAKTVAPPAEECSKVEPEEIVVAKEKFGEIKSNENKLSLEPVLAEVVGSHEVYTGVNTKTPIGFAIANKGPNAMVARTGDRDGLLRHFVFEAPGEARQDIHLEVWDFPHEKLSETQTLHLYLFPRKQLPTIQENGGKSNVTLATGEQVQFDSATGMIAGGVLTEDKMAVGSAPRVSYRGKGVAVAISARGKDARINGGTATISRRGARPCTVPSQSLWTEDHARGGVVSFRYATDEAFNSFLKSTCGFSLSD